MADANQVILPLKVVFMIVQVTTLVLIAYARVTTPLAHLLTLSFHFNRRNSSLYQWVVLPTSTQAIGRAMNSKYLYLHRFQLDCLLRNLALL